MKLRDRIVDFRRVPADTLLPHPVNWREHPAPQRNALRDLLAEIGIANAVIARDTPDGLQLIDGHLRREEIGKGDIPVLVLDLTEKEAEKMLLALDPLAGMARSNKDRLEELLARNRDLPNELLQRLDKEVGAGSERTDDEDEVPEPDGPTITAPGDLWRLGDHRLLCGDATDPESYRRLLVSRRAQLVFTDPPYGVDYESEATGKVAGDDKHRDDLTNLLLPSFKALARYAVGDAAFYIWHASITREDFAWAMRQAGLEEIQYLIWAKPSVTLGWGDYLWAHEPCFYACKAGHSPKFYGDRTQSTVWRVRTAQGTGAALGPGVVLSDGKGAEITITPKGSKKKMRHFRLEPDQPLLLESDGGDVWEVSRDTGTVHPTQKPVELARRALENSSRPGDAVLDPFLGSGTTLIGAELTGRACYGLELDPRLCDIIVQRWGRITGRVPEREGATE